MRTNKERLVKISVIGEVTSAWKGDTVYTITADGRPVVLPGVGGVTYNVRVGDSAIDWEADHVEPGVSIRSTTKLDGKEAGNNALNILSCVGNEAIVVSGEAKGERGVVTGKHGGIEHVLVDFDWEVLERIVPGDKVLVKAYGVGLKLLDYPEVKVFNMDPSFLEAMRIREEDGHLEVPVTHVIPAEIMGSGLGANNVYRGDYDIQLFDETIVKKYHLHDLRLGDIVAIMNADHSYGRIYRTGAISIGIIVHTRCVSSGHGPGVTTLMSSHNGVIRPIIDPDANIAKILKLRDDI